MILHTFLDTCRDLVRGFMRKVARGINKLTHGQVSPTSITMIALVAHVPIAWLIAIDQNTAAAVLLVFFGLFDTLDGELARLQGKAGDAGMLLDAATDRIKEVFLYCGAAYVLVAQGRPYFAVWAVAACGASLAVSYVKAKGETAVAGQNLTNQQVNRLFQDGFLRYEIRMFILFVGLLSGRLGIALVAIAVFSTFTAFGRLYRITSHLNDVKS